MRSIVNISLPREVAREIKKEVKEGGFASTSEFFRNALKSWKRERFFADLEQSRKEIAAGKGKILKSLKDLR